MKKNSTLWQINLRPDADLSLQRQLHHHVRDSILQGELEPGSKLPPSRTLARELSVGRITVTEAYDQLIAEGYLEAKQGSGTFVAEHIPDAMVAIAAETDPTPAAQQPDKAPPLMSGMPALDEFPADRWARVAGRVARRLDVLHMYHGDPMGYLPLRTSIAAYLKSSRNVTCMPSQVMIVSGLQQGLFLLASTIMDGSAPIILEDPGYDGLHAAAKASGKPVSFTSVDLLGATPPSRRGLLVTSPSRQYPLGYTMPHARRLELLAWARETDSFILEDDYDSEFRYAGRPLNSLQGIAGGDRVIYGGTFSKSLFPALRLGYLVLPQGLIDPICGLRMAIDSFPSISNQQVLHAFMEDGEFSRHVRRLRKIHSQRKTLFETIARKQLGDWIDLQPSDAGLHMLGWLTERALALNLKDDLVADWAQSSNVGAIPVSNCYRQTPSRQGLLMGFANLQEKQIEPAIQALASRIRQETGFSS